ncbi:unnamed protein product, partial [Thlaspi arvense]
IKTRAVTNPVKDLLAIPSTTILFYLGTKENESETNRDARVLISKRRPSVMSIYKAQFRADLIANASATNADPTKAFDPESNCSTRSLGATALSRWIAVAAQNAAALTMPILRWIERTGEEGEVSFRAIELPKMVTRL